MSDPSKAITRYGGPQELQSEAVTTPEIHQGPDFGLRGKVMQMALERIRYRATANERAKQREEESKQKAAELQKKYDREFAEESKAYNKQRANLQAQVDEEFERATENYNKKLEQYLEQEEKAIKQLESEHAAEVEAFNANFDKQLERYKNNLQHFVPRVREWCEHTEGYFIKRKMIKAILNNSEPFAKLLTKHYSDDQPTVSDAIRQIMNTMVYPLLKKEEFNVWFENDLEKQIASNYQKARRASQENRFVVDPRSILSSLEPFHDALRECYKPPHNRDYYRDMRLYELRNHTSFKEAHDQVGYIHARQYLGDYIRIYCDNLIEEAAAGENPILKRDISALVHTCSSNIGYLLYSGHNPELANSSEKVDLSDKIEAVLFLFRIVEGIAPFPPHTAYPAPPGPPDYKKARERLGKRKPIQPTRKLIDPGEPPVRKVAHPEMPEPEVIPERKPFQLPTLENLNEVSAHLQTFMIRLGIRRRYYETAYDGVQTTPDARFYFDLSRAAFNKQSDTYAPHFQLGIYKSLPRFGFWIKKTKGDFEKEQAESAMDPQIGSLYVLTEYIYKINSVAAVYVQQGNEQQRKHGEILLEMVSIYDEYLAEMAVNMEAKLQTGDFNTEEIMYAVQEIAPLLNSHSLKHIMESAIHGGEGLDAAADIQQALNPSLENFDLRLQQTQEANKSENAENSDADPE